MRKGDFYRGHEIIETFDLSNGWQLSKWTGEKGKEDFKVKLISPDHPYGWMIKHAHFAIDFYGKLCQDEKQAKKLLDIIIELWHGTDAGNLIAKYENDFRNTSGYTLEYILRSLDWILEQEDINFEYRREKKQIELDAKLARFNYSVPQGREGGQLAIAMFCDIAFGIHPVEAFYSANLRI